MLLPIEYEKLNDEKCQFIDVRSPGEFEQETICGAINIPLFTDQERKMIGTMYKQESPEKAKRAGIAIVSEKLPDIYDQIIRIRKETGKRLVLFCARGGMRSTSLALWLNGVGESVSYIKGGYKGYRKTVLRDLPALSSQVTYVVLHGKTGVGKTELLKRLQVLGYDILDLEGGANHRGSILGSVGLGQQPTTKAFESFVYHCLKSRKTNYVFVEAESRRIGNLFVPKCVKEDMGKGIQILIDADLDFRAGHLIHEYTGLEPGEPELIHAIEQLKRYISNDKADQLKALVMTGDFQSVARDLMIDYYDPMYQHSIDKQTFDHTLHIRDFQSGAETLGDWLDNYIQQQEDTVE